MVTVKWNCEGCAIKQMAPAASAHLTLFENSPERSHVLMTCPACGAVRLIFVDEDLFRQIRDAGAPVFVTRIPDEWGDADRRQPPIGDLSDALIDLHQWMADL